jgi:hypothetical protein
VRTDLGQSVQAAVTSAADTNGDGYVLVGVRAHPAGQYGGHTQEAVLIDRTFGLPFGLVGCSVALRDPTPGDAAPAARVTASASAPPDGRGSNIFVMDLHGENSGVAGWKVEGSGRYLRNVDARGSAVGFWIAGSGNVLHNATAELNSGAGVLVQGDGNLVDNADAFENVGEGVRVVGNANTITKTDLGDRNRGNGGDGLFVSGVGNSILENSAFGNAGDGVEVVFGSPGAPNVLRQNSVGDRNKGNSGNGIVVTGPGNGATAPIELESNTTRSNGLAGIVVTGTGHQLKNNRSGGTGSGETNVGCEFQVVSGNVNNTGNTSNGAAVVGSNGSPFPTGCIGSS